MGSDTRDRAEAPKTPRAAFCGRGGIPARRGRFRPSYAILGGLVAVAARGVVYVVMVAKW